MSEYCIDRVNELDIEDRLFGVSERGFVREFRVRLLYKDINGEIRYSNTLDLIDKYPGLTEEELRRVYPYATRSMAENSRLKPKLKCGDIRWHAGMTFPAISVGTSELRLHTAKVIGITVDRDKGGVFYDLEVRRGVSSPFQVREVPEHVFLKAFTYTCDPRSTEVTA